MLPPCSKIVADNNYASRHTGIRRHKLTHLGMSGRRRVPVERQIDQIRLGSKPACYLPDAVQAAD
jgi:hypothetical protein